MKSVAGKTQALAACGVLAAVCVALNFVASLHIVRLDLVFYLLSGALVFFAAARFWAGYGLALYAAASLLSLAVAPDKVWLLFFIGVFGPAAVLQSVFEKRFGRRASAVLAMAACAALFMVFGFVVAFVAYGGDPGLLIGLPGFDAVPGFLPLTGFAVFSAVIACIVNRGFAAMLSQRLKGGADAKKAGGIIIPKLSDDDES